MRVEESITIGELSRRTGVNIETIRYFERVGVLATPPRTSGGRRVYGTGLSIGVQKGPPIGVQKGPPLSSSVTGMMGALFALVAA